MLNNISYYTTLQELFGDLNLPNTTITQLRVAVPDFLDALDLGQKNFSTNDQVLELFKDYIVPSFYKSIVDFQFIKEGEEPDREHEDLLADIYQWLNTTIKSYGVTAKLYTDNTNKLLDKVMSTTTTTSRSSDTPELEGVWDGNDQLSAIAASTTESSADTSTMILKLDEIRKKYRDIMELWKGDFYSKFCGEGLTW